MRPRPSSRKANESKESDSRQSFATQSLEALKALHGEQSYLQEAQTKLLSIVDKFVRSSNGASVRLEGLSLPGRIHFCRLVEERAAEDVELVTINYDELFTDTTCAERFEKDTGQRRIFFVFNADHFISSFRQTLLYKLLNGSMLFPWLVILAVNGQDFYGHLEKRVRSRLSPDRISVHSAPHIAAFSAYFFKLLACEKFPELANVFTACNFSKPLQELYQVNSTYEVLKRCAALLLTELSPFDQPSREQAEEAMRVALHSLYPALSNKPPLFNILRDLSLRQLAVLQCATRLLKQLSSSEQLSNSSIPHISFRRIFEDYKKLANHSYRLLDVSSDKIVYEELCRLGQLGLLAIGNKTTNLSFQKVSLNVDIYSLEEHLKAQSLPTRVQDYFAHVSAM